MNQTDIIKYFDEYIKNYSPYTNDKNFTSFVDYLSSKYAYELYESIPYQFKQLFEQNKIPNDLYDIFLESIGIPKKILSVLSQIDKINFFNNFSNFYRFRGNIEFFNKISKLNSNSTFDVYELYIDYFDNNWIFKPNKIINNIDSEFNYLDYDDVYNEVPNFLINKTQLNSYKDNNNLILPLKSNLVLLNYSFLYESTGLSNLIFSTFLKEYRNKTITIYFTDEKFNITLKTFVLIWFYLFLKLYDDTSFIQISDVFKCLLYSNTSNPYNIIDLEVIISKYNNISNSYESYLFYNQYLENYFLKPITFNEYKESNLKNFIPSDIINYLNSRISSYDSEIIINTYNNIFTELLNSFDVYLNLTTDEYFLQYSDIFLNSLTKLIISPEKTGSFKLLNHYKPYHVDFITDYSAKVVYDSKFDMILPAVNYNLKINHNYNENFNIVDYSTSKIKYGKNNVLNIIESSSFKYNQLLNTELNINEDISIGTFSKNEDLYNFLDYNNAQINIQNNDLLYITEFVNIKHLLPNVQYIIHTVQQIELYCDYSNYKIYYTLDGSIPTTDSILYTSIINYTHPIKAIAYSDLDNSYSNILVISYNYLTIETEYLTIDDNYSVI